MNFLNKNAHWGRWNFAPTEAYPMGGFEFQAVLILVMLYLVVTGNQGVASTQASAKGEQQ